MARSTWTDSLDLDLAIRNVRIDSQGDWYRDPWGWPEYEYARTDGKEKLLSRARGSGAKRIAKIDVPKSGFLTRPAVVLEPIDRLVYQAIVDSIASKLLDATPDWVYGWRTPRTNDPSTSRIYSRQKREWDLFRSHLQVCVSVLGIGLKTDIVSCFASIPADRLCDDLERTSGRGERTDRLTGMLKAWDRVQGRRGLSQRSLASCVLANSYLARIDEVLKEFELRNVRGLLARLIKSTSITVRWMDDIWAFATHESDLRSLQYDIESTAREAGLELNAAKTAVLEGDELADEALKLEHSAIDESLEQEVPDVEPLEELLDRIIADPVNVDRTTIRFAMTRMRKHRVASRLIRLRDAAPKMPQGADHLARAFRDFKVWPDLQDWYLEYERSNWARNRWGVSQLGTMFPTKPAGISTELIERFSELLMPRPPLPLAALTVQRLTSWAPAKAQECIRSLVESADHPLERRVLGLAALNLREEKHFVRGILGEYEEHDILLAAVEGRDFRPFDPVRDFAADVEADPEG